MISIPPFFFLAQTYVIFYAAITMQTSRIRFEFHKGAADCTFMRIDGEPWKQPLPKDDDAVVVEISHHGQVSMLATPLCRSKSVNDPPHLPMTAKKMIAVKKNHQKIGKNGANLAQLRHSNILMELI